MKPWLIYDCEIIKGILKKDDYPIPGVQYCDGWRDFANMGISVICAYDYGESRYRVFCRDNFEDFQSLAEDRNVVSFNGLAFDDKLCEANGLRVKTQYDILVATWVAAGLPPEFSYPTHIGYGLDAICQANHIGRKTGNGALAPIQWQQGKIGAVIDYCLHDVRITKLLFDEILSVGKLTSPVERKVLYLSSPVSEAK